MSHYFLASTYENRNPDLARHHFAQAIEAATAAGHAHLATACAEGLGFVEFDSGDFDAGLRRVEAALAARRRSAATKRWRRHLPQYAMMLIAADRFDDADRALRRAEQLLGDEVRIAAIVAATARARLERHRGRPAIARRHAQRALDMIEATGARRVEPLPRVDAGPARPRRRRRRLGDRRPRGGGEDGDRDRRRSSMLADVLDAATMVAMALGRADSAGVISGAADALRRAAHVVRGVPEQAELDARARSAGGVAELDAAATGGCRRRPGGVRRSRRSARPSTRLREQRSASG